MDPIDEPVLKVGKGAADGGTPEPRSLPDRIRRLLESQPFAVLCTQGRKQPYGSVIAFAFCDDLTAAVFATSRATRKFHLLTESDRVALVVDNRGSWPGDLMQVEAITATGRARELPAGRERDRFGGLLIARHPHLRDFVNSPSSAVFRIEITRFFHVVRFQEVTQWTPKTPA
jgi:nitroimidazol reductase NimA-like FMN-containing flavoprotein (pyridoxamine 5'-phosphate oxidase superfamily)